LSTTVSVVSRISDSRRNKKEKRKKKEKFTRERANARGRNHKRAAGCHSVKWIYNACTNRNEYQTDISRDEILIVRGRTDVIARRGSAPRPTIKCSDHAVHKLDGTSSQNETTDQLVIITNNELNTSYA